MFGCPFDVVKAIIPVVHVTHDDLVGSLCINGIPKWPGYANYHCGSNQQH